MDLDISILFGVVLCFGLFFLAAWLWQRAVGYASDWAADYMAYHKPDFTIKYKRDKNIIYLDRWHLIPRNAWCNLYLHCAYADDESADPHDHPYDNMSIVLDGGYWEHFTDRKVWRAPGAVIFRRAETLHRLTLPHRWLTPAKGAWLPGNVRRVSDHSVSLFITGPRRRDWGFMTKDGWVFYEKYNARANNTSDFAGNA